MPSGIVGAEGLEASGQNAGETAESQIGGTPGGSLPKDDRLRAVIEAWPLLSEVGRRSIFAVVQSPQPPPREG